MLVADGAKRTLFANEAFTRLTGHRAAELPDLDALARCFAEPLRAGRLFTALGGDGPSWRGELDLAGPTALPVSLRAEVVPARDGSVLGFILMFEDLSEAKRAARARSVSPYASVSINPAMA